jgi:hypothetical protein
MMIARDKAAAGSWWWVIKEQRQKAPSSVYSSGENSL